jgi:hypothetical protein
LDADAGGQAGEFHAGEPTALKRIQQGFPLGQRDTHPPNVGVPTSGIKPSVSGQLLFLQLS